MGTSGTCGFIRKGEPKLGYNHFDSYPEGLGVQMIDMIININEEDGWDKFKEQADKIKELYREDINPELIEKYKQYSDLNVSEQTYYDPYCLLRNIQGYSWLLEMYNNELEHYEFNNNFIKDSLFCEFGYIINLDTMMFEFYKGYQSSPQSNNPFGEEANDDGYYPCRLVSVIPLCDVNKDTFELENDEEVVDYLEKIK